MLMSGDSRRVAPERASLLACYTTIDASKFRIPCGGKRDRRRQCRGWLLGTSASGPHTRRPVGNIQLGNTESKIAGHEAIVCCVANAMYLRNLLIKGHPCYEAACALDSQRMS
jgi:hypothetical protein